MNTTAPAAVIDPARFRQVLGHYPTGVAVITAIGAQGDPIGMTVGSFASVSLEPMLVSFMPMSSSRTFAALREADSFCVNVLAGDQESYARRFARFGTDRFDGVAWTPGRSGAPVLDGAIASIECTYEQIIPAGDHEIVLGAVTSLDITRPVSPLVFFQGGYGKFSMLSADDRSPAEIIESVRLAELFRGEMQQTADALGVECTAMTLVGSDLTVIASATAPGVEPQGRLGSRIPYMPPLGELYAALDAPLGAERWLGRSAAVEGDDVVERYRERLGRAREQGWSISYAGDYPDVALVEALRDYSSGELTPVRMKEIGEVIRSASRYYEDREIVDGESYDITSMVAPVTCRGRIRFVLRLRQLPAGASAAQVREWIDALTAAAERASRTLDAESRCSAE